MTRALLSRVSLTLDHEFSAAVGLVVGVGVALGWSASSTSYFTVLSSTWRSSPLTTLGLDSPHDVVVNALMAIFFFALGLELARELFAGQSTQTRDAMAPILAAVGGMSVTALGSLVVGHLWHSGALERGWGVPMATDVAFSLGVLAVAGRRLPPALRVFLLTLAIADDVLSVIVLSVTGTTHPRASGLVAIIVTSLIGVFLTRRMTSNVLAVVFFVLLWCCFAWANVEPALSGVLAGGVVTYSSTSRRRLERNATRLSVVLVLPLFALVACGVRWHDVRWSGPVGTVILATIALRLIGKTLGISVGVSFARLLRFQVDPSITWPLIVTTGLVCAIGFTVPLLFATKLFGAQSSTYAGFTLGLLVSSAVAALLGGALLGRLSRRE